MNDEQVVARAILMSTAALIKAVSMAQHNMVCRPGQEYPREFFFALEQDLKSIATSTLTGCVDGGDEADVDASIEAEESGVRDE